MATGTSVAAARGQLSGAGDLMRDDRPKVTQMAPRTAGITLPGRQNSAVMERTPKEISKIAMLGSESICSHSNL